MIFDKNIKDYLVSDSEEDRLIDGGGRGGSHHDSASQSEFGHLSTYVDNLHSDHAFEGGANLIQSNVTDASRAPKQKERKIVIDKSSEAK